MTSSDPNGSDGPTPKNWVSLYIQEAENLAARRLPLETIPRSARPVIRKWIDSNITEEELALVSIYLDWEINWIGQILDTWTGNDTEILRAVDALLYAVSRRPRNGLTEITRVFNDPSPSVAHKMSDILQAIPSVWQINRNQKGLERKLDSANSSALVTGPL